MKTSKLILVAAIAFFGVVLFSSCKKDNNTSNPQQTAANNMFDRNLLVSMATDNGATVTADFAGLTFRFTGSASLSGTATVANDLLTVTGNWTMTAGYDKITFSFPTNIFGQLSYMNKQWLISANSSSTVVLNAANGESDALNFSTK